MLTRRPSMLICRCNTGHQEPSFREKATHSSSGASCFTCILYHNAYDVCQVQQADDAAKQSKRPFLAEAIDLGLIDPSAAEQFCMKIGEGAHPDLRKKWDEYKAWDYKSVSAQLKGIMQARNALNHNQAMDADQVLKAMEHQRDVLQALQIDASQLETMITDMQCLALQKSLTINVTGESQEQRLRRVPFRVKEEELIGRASVIDTLVATLTPAGTQQIITGIGGVGKTMVAAAAAKKLIEAKHVTCAFFLQASSENTLRAELARFGRSYVSGCALDASDSDAIAAAKQFFMHSSLEWVAVLDDVSSLDEVQELMPTGAHGRLVFTSSTELGNAHNINTMRLDNFSTQESLQMLRSVTVKGKKVAQELRGEEATDLSDRLAWFCEVGDGSLATD